MFTAGAKNNDLNGVLVHISTDYVFDGNSSQPYTERSEPFPLSVYANSKLAGEWLVRTMAIKVIVAELAHLLVGDLRQPLRGKTERGTP